MVSKQVNTKDELRRDGMAILTYVKMHKLKGHQRLTNRRQRRLWKTVDGPFQAFANKFRRKIWEDIECAILYGKEK